MLENFFIIFANGFLTLFYYFQKYLWYLILFIMLIVMAGIEYHEKKVLMISDERKVT